MKKLITILSVISIFVVNGQAQILQNGIIKFERKTNLRLQMQNAKSEMNFGGQDFIKQLPTAVSSYFELAFTPEKSMYTFKENQKVEGIASYFVNDGPARENAVYRNLQNDSLSASKKFYDADFLIKDVALQPEWKFSDEMRVIAGYNCRKAVTTIYDSLIVVAFYTDEIIAESGPESFAGLPGMILGIAVPKLYTTWFATEVKAIVPPAESFKTNFKGKATTLQGVDETIQKASKDWGAWGMLGRWWMKI